MSKPKWQETQQQVLSLLKDTIPEGSTKTPRYDPDDVIAWWNNAQVRLATMRPISAYRPYSDNDGVVLPLPENFYRARHVIYEGGSLPRVSI